VPYFGKRYRLGNVIGRGGFGVVYEARDEYTGRDVALKLFSQGAISQAVLEARLLTALEGPHILRVLNADVYQDVPFNASEIAPLGSAADHVGALGTSVPRAVRWTRHLLLGLESCHRAGLVHRDVKPSNLFLQDEDLAQLGDFGVAEIADGAGTVPASGDVRIRAPEMWMTQAGGIRSDIFSVGVTLYYLLSGRYPIVGTNDEIATAITSESYAPIRDVAPHVSRALADRVRKAMSLDPAQRFATAEEMHRSLGQLAATEREWKRVPTHDGHVECWEGPGGVGAPSFRTCVVSDGANGFGIETRRMTTSAPRVVARSKTGLRNGAELLVELRRTLT
jgi:serine/threonine-protein kinase